LLFFWGEGSCFGPWPPGGRGRRRGAERPSRQHARPGPLALDPPAPLSLATQVPRPRPWSADGGRQEVKTYSQGAQHPGRTGNGPGGPASGHSGGAWSGNNSGNSWSNSGGSWSGYNNGSRSNSGNTWSSPAPARQTKSQSEEETPRDLLTKEAHNSRADPVGLSQAIEKAINPARAYPGRIPRGGGGTQRRGP
jgi:hypothetical protein